MADQPSSKWDSRKYKAAWKLTWVFIVLFTLPPLISCLVSLLWKPLAFTLISDTIFCSVVTFLWVGYFGVNLAQKTSLFGGVPKDELASKITTKVKDFIDPEKDVAPVSKDDPAGGQPAE